MTPVEKMAARVLLKHKLQPPYDLNALVENYADVEQHHFPIKADGVTIGIGGDKKPLILINSSPPITRKKFTLAHELGHVIIPWHTGTIVSHLNPVGASLEYKEMESEANQFAAELLIPKSWLLSLQKGFTSVEHFINKIIEESGASRDAVFIKFFNIVEIPIICAELSMDGEFKSYRTRTAPTGAGLSVESLSNDKVFTTASSEEKFSIGDRSYKAWVFNNENIKSTETDPRPWREVLKQILDETDSHHLRPSINAILPSQYSSHKEKSEAEICALIIQSYDVRGGFDSLVAHPLFPQYVVKRIKELMAKNKVK